MKRDDLGFLMLLLFLLDFIFVLLGYTKSIDNRVYQGIISFQSEKVTVFFKWISFLASTRMIVLYHLFLFFFILWKKQYTFFFVPLMSITSGITNRILKWLIKRKRPIGIALVKERFYSFPSGHAMISILFFGSLLYVLYQTHKRKKEKWTILVIVFILLVGISRIYLGVHYFSDVLGGYLFGGCLLLLGSHYIEKVGIK